jgi:hypothetical protein
MEWIYLGILLVIAIVVILRQSDADFKRNLKRNERFAEAARKVGLAVWYSSSERDVWGVIGKIQLPKDHFPRMSPIVHGEFKGWRVIWWNFSYNSNPVDSHTGSGARRDFFAVALSKSSARLPSFRTDGHRDIRKIAGSENLSKTALEELAAGLRQGWTVECDGHWLLVKGSGWAAPSEDGLQRLVSFADSIS